MQKCYNLKIARLLLFYAIFSGVFVCETNLGKVLYILIAARIIEVFKIMK